jgi:hypothetical protein
MWISLAHAFERDWVEYWKSGVDKIVRLRVPAVVLVGH